MPSLRELEAHFTIYSKVAVDPTIFIDGVKHTDGWSESFKWVDTLAEADGIWFKCPLCFKSETEYAHPVRIGFRGKATPGSYGCNNKGEPVLWELNPKSTGLDDLVLTPSIQIQGGCNWHGFVGSNNVKPGFAE